jgi:hypothetical protein
MAITLRIDNGDFRGRADYTRYLAAPERSPAVLRDRMNQPSLLDFTLVPADARFVVPRRSAFVVLEGLADALPPGGPRAPGPLFTGYVTNEPAIEFLGIVNGRAVHGYRCQATSEEYLLNVKRIGLLPPFLNQTAGEILRVLTARLQPGRFDTSGIADGVRIAQFAVDPDRSWSEIARELAERSGFYYRVLDGKIEFAPVDAAPAGVVIDARDRRFRPEALEISPLGNPIQNDVTVLGGAEPQAHVVEYFGGDGFASRFPLVAPVFGAESARLLADDFTGAGIDSTRWEESDPGGHITPFDGRLNVTGGLGLLGETTLRARQAIELGGELELLHGEFEFVSSSTGILGGLYTDASLGLGQCLLGFDAAPIAGQTRLRAVVSGAVLPLEVITQPEHHYVLVTRISADQPYRVQQSYTSLEELFGGTELEASARVALEVRDFDAAGPAPPVVTVLFEGALEAIPAVALYAPINSADLHLVMNFLQVTRPIQAWLETHKPTETPRVRTLGFGIAGQDATITSDPNSNQWALEFYEDTIPEAGERITLRYRAAGRSLARVRDGASVAAEAALAGDDGIRATVLREINPPPRTSAEAELAARAYLADHAAPRYEGRYTTWSEFADLFPRSGRRITVRDESRYPVFSALVRGVTSELRELATERILHTLEFGQPSRFEDMLARLVPAGDILKPEEPAPLEPVESAEPLDRYLPDAAGFTLAQIVSTHYFVDMGEPPPAGGAYQVRRTDRGWSSATAPGTLQNLVAQPATQAFVLARTGRNQTFFIRPVDTDGTTSRHSAVLSLHLPLVPPAPAALIIGFGVDSEQKPVITATVEVGEQNLADVDRVELRDEDGQTVLAEWGFGQLRREGQRYRAELVIDNSQSLLRAKTLYAYTRNLLGEYSAALSASAAKVEPPKPSLLPGHSVGQILEVLLDRRETPIVETEIQVAGPDGSFDPPVQGIRVAGNVEKFNFVAPQSGGFGFRARRRDELGWSPWSNEPQGQIGPQILIFDVSFFRARELDPSIGAAINAQNLLPNSEFFLPGIPNQEGVHAARYYRLVNAAADGSEVDHAVSANEMQWRSGVNFSAGDPGFRSLLANLGRLFNPGESVTLAAALRHSGALRFARPVRLSLRSPANPGYNRMVELAENTITGDYRWYSATFLLPADQAVPEDLAVELTVVVAPGLSLATDLYCDKLILNRGHRPAAFTMAPWDLAPLEWNALLGAYELPATAVAASPRGSDPGNAGRLVGTGTEDLDPDFTERYIRLIN